MSIVTKTGDKGTTCLAFGRKVAKDHVVSRHGEEPDRARENT